MINTRLKKMTVCSLLLLSATLHAQDAVTNAFEDLKRQGIVNEKDSEMRRSASHESIQKMLQDRPFPDIFVLRKTACMIFVCRMLFRNGG